MGPARERVRRGLDAAAIWSHGGKNCPTRGLSRRIWTPSTGLVRAYRPSRLSRAAAAFPSLEKTLSPTPRRPPQSWGQLEDNNTFFWKGGRGSRHKGSRTRTISHLFREQPRAHSKRTPSVRLPAQNTAVPDCVVENLRVYPIFSKASTFFSPGEVVLLSPWRWLHPARGPAGRAAVARSVNSARASSGLRSISTSRA